MKNILACDLVPSVRAADIAPPSRSLRADTLSANMKPIRLETRWRAVDPHLKRYCRDLSERLMANDGQRQRAPRANDRVKFELAVEVIVCNLVALALSGEEHRSIAIIKANHASSTSQIYGKPFNRAVDLMEYLGLVTVEVGYRFDRWSRASSTITAAPDIKIPGVIGWDALKLADHEHLIALNADGQRPRQPPNLEREVIAINAHLCTANVEVVARKSEHVTHVANWTSTITDRLVTPHHRQLHRAFKGDYNSGGRLFGGWWQTLPRGLRKHIRIGDGSAAVRLEPVVNVDFSAMHLKLAYAKAGRARETAGERVPRGDLYDLACFSNYGTAISVIRGQ